MFTATYLANRSPHSTLEGATPYSKMHNLEPDLTGLRAIGARAFVHRETYNREAGRQGLRGKTVRIQPQQQGVPHLQSSQRYGRGEPERHLPGNAGIHSTSGCHDGRLPLRGRRSSVHVGVRLISPEEDLFTSNCDLSSAELEGQVQRLRQEVRRLSKINAAQSPSLSFTPPSPGVAVDQRDAGTREPEPASPSINQEPENEDEYGPPLPAAPVTGPSLRIRSDGRPFEVTRASTRRSPSNKDTEYPGALHALFPTHDHDPRALTSSQLFHIATQTTPSMLTTADSAHLDGQPFDTPRAFVYATGVPVPKGFSKEGQPVRIPNRYKDAQKSPQWGDWNNAI